MIVDVQVDIKGSAPAVWAVLADFERYAETIRGIEKIEILARPAHGLVGLKWRETRILFGKPASADKWITEAADNAFYKTRAESDGFIFLSDTRIRDNGNGSVTLSSSHDSRPQTLATKIMSIPMNLFFRGVAKKALLEDLKDVKSAVENGSRN